MRAKLLRVLRNLFMFVYINGINEIAFFYLRYENKKMEFPT